ncbi:HAD family hydrolase [soil metagenome]
MNLFPNAKWIFFDVGYTLLDETPGWTPLFESLSTELSRAGRPTSVAKIWEMFHAVASEFERKQWIGLCRRLAVDQSEAERFEKVALQWKHELQVPYARAGDVLRVLSQHYKLGIIANQWIGTADRMRQHGWADYFSLIIGSAEAGVVKPDPKIFQMAMAQAKCTPAEAVMVGDRIDNDVKPAKALGWGTVQVRQGIAAGQVARDASEEATAVVQHVADVPGLFGLALPIDSRG